MRSLDVDTQAAIRDRGHIVPRNFVVVTAKDRDSGDAVVHAFWNDAETVAVNVLDADGATVSHNFAGDGAILDMDAIPMRIGLEVRTVQIVLSPLSPKVQDLVRRDDPRGGQVEIYRGLFDPVGFVLLAPPRLRFLGRVNEAPIETAAAGGSSAATLRVVSHTRELTRTNPARKSDEQQKLRSGDRFRRYGGSVKDWPIFWGEKKS